MIDSRSPFSSGGVTTRATDGPANDTAQPSLTSGFGAVLEKEHELQTATGGQLEAIEGPRSDAIDRVLREQQIQLGATVALLEQRYEMLPHPARFQALPGTPAPGAAAERESRGTLPDLVAQHLELLNDIDALIACGSDGQRGELILTEVGRNHAQMAGALTALLREHTSVHDQMPVPVIAAGAVTRPAGVGNWENEGGALRPAAAPVAAVLPQP